MGPNKITLVGWVNHALKKSLTKQNIKSGFRTIDIWSLNPKAMDNKIRPSKIYIVANMNNVRNEKNYTTKEEAENNPQWGENFVVTKFLHKTGNKLTSNI
jgi:hypothetical protein